MGQDNLSLLQGTLVQPKGTKAMTRMGRQLPLWTEVSGCPIQARRPMASVAPVLALVSPSKDSKISQGKCPLLDKTRPYMYFKILAKDEQNRPDKSSLSLEILTEENLRALQLSKYLPVVSFLKWTSTCQSELYLCWYWNSDITKHLFGHSADVTTNQTKVVAIRQC